MYEYLLRGVRKIYRFLRTQTHSIDRSSIEYDSQGASEIIYKALISPDPCMISRFGSVELECLVEYLNQPSLRSALLYVQDKIPGMGISSSTMYNMRNNAGFYPVDINNIEKFCRRYLEDIEDIEDIDILGRWRKEEQVLEGFLRRAKKVARGHLEPFFLKEPWTKALTGKKVLVVHPFEATIKKQYKVREKLFLNPDILPSFELFTIKAVQTIAHNSTVYETWFDALEAMKLKIESVDFDIAIIGAGAYGLPLAAHVKRLGKKAVHLGGVTQLLFGIKGRRWEEGSLSYRTLFNEYWTRPSSDDRPENWQLVENGCYW